ncbi:hypothetical protein [Sphingomonas sp. Leaf339]|uniref:hypothetical protein n=1 Tax=Sphingomonas sp. Leaf339 TaxID=1736343 RepID=UPI0012E38E5A|nr:hypothetical protein [Sphingomonas sp. Leaf339]
MQISDALSHDDSHPKSRNSIPFEKAQPSRSPAIRVKVRAGGSVEWQIAPEQVIGMQMIRDTFSKLKAWF